MAHVRSDRGLLALATLASLFLVPAVASAQQPAASNSIPGVDIIVQKKPGGSAIRQKSDSAGKFSFNHLTPGDYTVSFVRPASQLRQSINTTRSNIKHQVALSGPIQVFTITLAIGLDTLPAYPITVTGAQGVITGTVVKAAPTPGKVIK